MELYHERNIVPWINGRDYKKGISQIFLTGYLESKTPCFQNTITLTLLYDCN